MPPVMKRCLTLYTKTWLTILLAVVESLRRDVEVSLNQRRRHKRKCNFLHKKKMIINECSVQTLKLKILNLKIERLTLIVTSSTFHIQNDPIVSTFGREIDDSAAIVLFPALIFVQATIVANIIHQEFKQCKLGLRSMKECP